MLASNITRQDFDYCDAYITIDVAMNHYPGYQWVNGSALSRTDFEEVYIKHFDLKIRTKEEAMTFIDKLSKCYNLEQLGRDYDAWNTGFHQIIEYLKKRFNLKEE